MKRTFLSALPLAMAALLLAGCSSNENQIRKIAFGYLDAMGNYRFADAYPYATKETQETTLKFIETSIMPKADTASLMKETPATITITNVNITSDTTATVMFHKSTPVSERNNVLQMVKRDGKWYANVVIDAANQPSALSGPKTTTFDTNSYKGKKFKVMHGAPPANKRRQ